MPANDTLHKQSRSAPQPSEESFRILVQNIPDYALFMLDPDARVTLWNEGAARLKGYTEQEIIGQHFSIFFTPDDRERGKPGYETGRAEAEGRYEGEGWRVRKDGSRFWGNEVITAVRDAAGRLTGFTKIVRDLTERKAMDDALRLSEERYRTVVEGVKDYAILAIDTDRIVTHVNQAARTILGYEPGEIIGRTSDVIFTPEDREAGRPQREQADADAQGRAEDERWHVRKGGSLFWGSGVLTAVKGAAGQTIGYFKVLRDRTTRKTLENERAALLAAERKAREEAEAAARLKDEFLAVASHELRTPLSAILLWSHLLKEGALDEQGRAEAAAIIRQQAGAQQRLIEDVLDVSRLSTGTMRLHLGSTDLSRVVGTAVETVRPMADAKGITIEGLFDPAVGKVRADPDRLSQVLWNLLTNAVKFSGEGAAVRVRLERAGDEVRLVVSDTGRGIGRDFLPHVFERFRQEDGSFTRREGGLGLGLPIVKQLVELHGGTVTAESEGEHRGATFTVRLPLPRVTRGRKGAGQPASSRPGKGSKKGTPPVGAAPAAGQGGASEPGLVLKGVRVLLVEDDEATRRAVTVVLRHEGAQVTAVASAAEALESLQRENEADRTHVLVSDVGMAGVNGYELIERVRSWESKRGRPPLPAAALTAYAREQDRQAAMAAGFHLHLRKPVEPAEVVRAVALLAGRE